MPRYACHFNIRMPTPQTTRTIDTGYDIYTSITRTHRLWDPAYPTFISLTHREDECMESDAHPRNINGNRGKISVAVKVAWREKLLGRRLVSGHEVGKGDDDDDIFNVQDLPAGKDEDGISCTRILGPLKGSFHDHVASRLTICVDEKDIVWDVYFG
ncbi:hypothetical protein TWF694_011170 [Orbilia ellipsospora]|uniref:Uncharacterized protein n=1 Tax=Orbilia ellipsospora TaxID=2528407 RepID=A0AAV9X8I9_9PEZI